ncbi:MAG: hypothetical protein C0P67_005060 [Bacillota bacterium]|uniref:hypothetical protein n=1 Tax=Planifilum fulgidum TaxID=201973 RepID=UPI0015A5964A
MDKALQPTRWNGVTFAVINTITDLAPILVIGFSGFLVIRGSMAVGKGPPSTVTWD